MRKILLLLPFLISSFFVKGQFGFQNNLTKTIEVPMDVKAFDIDGDGDMDILTASQNDDKIAWCENLGGGIIGDEHTINISDIDGSSVLGSNGDANGASSIYASDIDGDGDLDVLSTSLFDNKVAWYENLGGGIFGPQNIISTNVNYPVSIHSDDIDGDGDMDVLTASQNDDKIAWYENLGSGIFGAQQIISTNANYARSVFVADIDGDGDIDVLSASSQDAKIAWYENLGSGIIDTTQQIIAIVNNGALSVYSVDIDNDGDVDVLSAAAVSFGSNKILLHENLGGGSFGPQRIITSFIGANSVYVIDFDNDGDGDVLSSSYSDNKIVWNENLGGGTFGPQQIIATNASYVMSIYAADINADGNTDILSASRAAGGRTIDKVVWFKNLGGGTFDLEQRITPNADGATSVYAADLDNDGDIDMLSASTKENKIAWYENLGNGMFGHQQVISLTGSVVNSVYAIDLDGDLNIDVLSTSPANDQVRWHKNLGGGVFAPPQIVTDSADAASSVNAADLDNDGDIDILSASYNDDKIAWYENLGGGLFATEQIITNNADYATSVCTADLNGDGDLDVLSASLFDNKVAWYENLGGGTFGPQQIITILANGARCVSTADINNDGDIDVLSASQDDDKIAWYKNLGGGTFGVQQIITTNADGAMFVYAADLDSDGDIDIISASDLDNKIAWYENSGGNFGNQKIVTTLTNSARSVHAADLDNDGTLDVLSASYNDDKIAWYKSYFNSTYQFKGKLFYDANQNATLDINELGLSFIQTQLQPNGLANYTTSNGDYFFATDTGSYTVNYNPILSWNLTTDSLTYNQTLTGINPVIDNLNFGFYPDTIITIIEPSLIGGFPRCNDTINYWIDIYNQGTTVPSGVIHLQLNDSINYVNATFTPDSIIGQNIYWHYDSLFFFSSEMIKLQVQMPPFTSMGDTLTSILAVYEIDSLGSASIIYSNTNRLDQILVCAYDPNDKSVKPKGIGSKGYISQNQELEYLIRFQNTGNDTAKTVMIRDQLDANLNWNSLQPIANSHNVQISIEQNGEAVFKFENIMLPDSNVNFLGSQGFIKFKILPKVGLLPNTIIHNTGHIYFDANPAVVTNTVLNTIECYATPQPIVTYSFPYLNTTITGSYSYQWYYNGSIISGATADTLLPSGSGNYSVEVLDTNNCYKISVDYPYINVGVEEMQELETIVYPNPFSKSTTILFDKNLNENYNLLVYNIVGTEVKRINKITGNKVEVSKNEIGKGLFLTYLINTKTREKIFISKLIVL